LRKTDFEALPSTSGFASLSLLEHPDPWEPPKLSSIKEMDFYGNTEQLVLEAMLGICTVFWWLNAWLSRARAAARACRVGHNSWPEPVGQIAKALSPSIVA